MAIFRGPRPIASRSKTKLQIWWISPGQLRRPNPSHSKTVLGIWLISLTASTVVSRTRRALWRSTVHDAVSFRQRFEPASHPLLGEMCTRGPQFWALDILHVVDYHGVAAHCVANMFCDIIRDDELGSPNQSVTLERFGLALLSRS